MLIVAHGNQDGRLHNAHLKLEDYGLLIYYTMLLCYWFPSFQTTTMSSSYGVKESRNLHWLLVPWKRRHHGHSK